MILVRNGTLLDCTGEKPLPGGAVLMDGNRITYAGTEASLPRLAEPVEEVDAGGGFILPGFIDSHVHLNTENFNMEDWFMRPFSYNFYRVIPMMRRTIEAGITSVRDAGGTDLGMKRAVDEGLILGPRIQISVNALSITGGHNDAYMLSGIDPNPPLAYPGNPDGRCDGVEEVRKKVREMLRAGAEVIKICSTGGVMSPTDRPEYTQFSPEELAVIVQEARYHGGVRVMSHAQGNEGIKQAVLAGIFSIEHGFYLDDEVIRLMLERGTFLVPTLLATTSLTDGTSGTVLPEIMRRKAQEAVELHRASVARAYRAGVKIAMGTDAGVMPHGMNLRELELLCQIGMTPMEAVLATTRRAAECLGWENRVGTLEAGKLADVVVVRTNPLEDIPSLAKNENIPVVIKDGKIVKDCR
jgi:imidazolonepropionase-like amidohydrolase